MKLLSSTSFREFCTYWLIPLLEQGTEKQNNKQIINKSSGGELGFSYMGGKSSYLLMKGTCMSVNEDITEIPLNARFVRRKTPSMRVKWLVN